MLTASRSSTPLPVPAGDADHVIPATAAPNRTWSALGRPDRRRVVRSSLLGAAAGFIPFVLALWDVGLRPLRTVGAHGYASNFYDIQARALLRGHLSIPTDSIGIEGFVVDGRTFMYFPPFPALLRMPVMIFTDELDGKLTALSMLLAWMALATATAVLVWSTRLLARGTASITGVEVALGGLVVAAATGGSVVVYLGAQPWAFHEVYIWATAFSVGTVAALTTIIRRPTLRGAGVAAACTLGAMLTRATSGWAMAVALIVVGIVAWTRQDQRRVAPMLVAGGAVALLVGTAINWAKFRHPYLFPLRDQVFTDLNSHRRRVLDENGGHITGPQFFLSSLFNYFHPGGIRFVPYFPFITLPAEPARSYGGALLDQTYRTGSVPLFMPALFVSAIWGFVAAFRRRAATWTHRLRIPMVAALAITGGVMFYGYIAHRYTSEFLPVLIVGSAVAAVDVAGRLGDRPPRLKGVVIVTMAVLTLLGGAANAAAGITASRIAWRGDRLEQYVSWQLTLAQAAGNVDRLIAVSDSLPVEGAADTLQIVGDCDALYVATGDQYGPWVAVQARELRVEIAAGATGFFGGVLPLLDVDGLFDRTIRLESDFEGRVRLRIGEGDFYYPTEWVDLGPNETITAAVHLDSELDRFLITFGGSTVGEIPSLEADGDEPFTAAQARFALAPSVDQRIIGVTLTAVNGPPLDLCNRLLHEVDG